jgi:gas vesicle protein
VLLYRFKISFALPPLKIDLFRNFRVLKLEIMATKNNNLIALLAGAAIGLGLGILFAPDKGSKTREKLKENLDDLKEGAKEKFAKTNDDLKESVEELLSKSSDKTEEVISFLEEKLAELKKQNAKYQK